MAPGSDAEFNRESKHLPVKGQVKVPALSLFWRLRRVTPPSFCIDSFPPSCWSHLAFTWPGASVGTSPACPSLGIPTPEKPSRAEMNTQNRGRGPCVFVLCCSPYSNTSTLCLAHEGCLCSGSLGQAAMCHCWLLHRGSPAGFEGLPGCSTA